jgi:hypothetical protein
VNRERSDGTGLAPYERAIVRSVADLYAPPPLSSARRMRFDARLAERLAASAPRRRLLLATSLAAAAIALAAAWDFWMLSPRGREDVEVVSASSARLEVAAQDDDPILAMVGPIANADDALPEDYRAISDLLIGE